MCIKQQKGERLRLNNQLSGKIEKDLADYNKTVGHNYVPPLNVFRLSSSSECPRKLYYGKRFNHDFDDKTQRIFLVGQVLHELVQDVALKGFECEVELRKEIEDIIVVGHCDAVGHDRVIELKSCSRLPDNPHRHHVLQVNAYASVLGKEICNIVYVTKDRLSVRAFEFDTNKGDFDLLCGLFSIAHKGVKSELLPNKVSNSMCRYCNFKQLCDKDCK